MTLIRFNNQTAVNKNFNNLFEGFLNGFSSVNNEGQTHSLSKVPANIRETTDTYLVEVIAPGFDKNDLKVSFDKNLLTITGERNDEVRENEKFVRKEYTFHSFNRTFTVDEKIDASNITAKYENGILTLNLPKKVEVKESTKKISIQ